MSLYNFMNDLCKKQLHSFLYTTQRTYLKFQEISCLLKVFKLDNNTLLKQKSIENNASH